MKLENIRQKILSCSICEERFRKTETAHKPRPIIRVSGTARILVAGQAPGNQAAKSGLPFDDRSGDRLREWMGIGRETFYDEAKVAVVPMAFCFPGYRKGADLPPPPVCARTWHGELFKALPRFRLRLLVGGHAHKWHLGEARGKRVSETVEAWRERAPGTFALPHPSWRNDGWLKRNPWFESDVLPELRQAVRRSLSQSQ